MSLLDFLKRVELEEYELREFYEHLKQRFHHHCRVVSGRFDGPYTLGPNGEIIMATFQINIGTAYTGKLIFTGSDGSTPPGPIGTISFSDPNTTGSLSADGQSYNITSNAVSGTVVTATWNPPSGSAVPSFTAQFTDQPVPVTVTGAFGAPTPGTTA